MTYILIAVNLIANIILLPFHLIYKVADYLDKNQGDADSLGVIGLGVGWGVIIFLFKNPVKHSWFSYIMTWIVAFSITLGLFIFFRMLIVMILKFICNLPEEIYEDNKKRIDDLKDRVYAKNQPKYQDAKKKRIEKAQRRYAKKNKGEIKQQGDAEVSLAYFLEREENVIVPYIRYLGD